jgi:hypothetical protein
MEMMEMEYKELEERPGVAYVVFATLIFGGSASVLVFLYISPLPRLALNWGHICSWF